VVVRSGTQNRTGGVAPPAPYDDRTDPRRKPVDVRIGVTYSPKELTVELPDDTDAAKLRAQIDDSLGDDDGVLWLTDRKGRQVGVPVSKVSYVEIGSPDTDRRVGFGS
jgi:hypothetical protein